MTDPAADRRLDRMISHARTLSQLGRQMREDAKETNAAGDSLPPLAGFSANGHMSHSFDALDAVAEGTFKHSRGLAGRIRAFASVAAESSDRIAASNGDVRGEVEG